MIPKDRSNLAKKWLRKSILCNDGQGSSGFFDLRNGWSAAYPETTGYLIETLLDWEMEKEAISCAYWLLGLQRKDGSFPGGIGSDLARPSIVFDTAMILFGLLAAFRQTKEERFAKAAEKACQWLMNCEKNGYFKQFTYVKNYSPAYHLRVVWAMLATNSYLQNWQIENKAQTLFHSYASLLQPNGTFRDWGFRPNAQALTHTIMYTYRGYLESGLLLQNPDTLERVEQMINRFQKAASSFKQIPAKFDENWEGDTSFRCLVGEAQYCCLLFRLFQLTQNDTYLAQACNQLYALRQMICRWPIPGMHGGLPGSWPLHGNYQRFRFINWGIKFYLDAEQLFRQDLT
ncbi:MAG: hypothetical protein MRY78_04455 [Saprospiraceae bacterium]|nr:hypothetical protein [Saprospiraceae bacterium]